MSGYLFVILGIRWYLYLYEDGCNSDLTAKLKEAYEELVLKNKKNFEVVLVYIINSWQTNHTTEETFWKAFKTMPWLANPIQRPKLYQVAEDVRLSHAVECFQP